MNEKTTIQRHPMQDEVDGIIRVTAMQREWIAIEEEFHSHPQSMAREIYRLRRIIGDQAHD